MVGRPVGVGLVEPGHDWLERADVLATGAHVEPAELVAHARALGEPLVAEGVGGLLVPLTSGYSVRDLAVDLELPVVIAARAGLGTINHTLLTIESARAVGLTVRCVVLTPWPDGPSTMERSNRATIEQLGGAPVHGLPPVTPATLPADLDWAAA